MLGDGWEASSFIDNNSFNNSVGSHIGYGTYLSVEDMRDFVGTNNTFTGTGSRAVGIFAYGDGTPGGQDVTGTEYADGFFGSEFVAGSGNNSTFHGLGGNDSMYGGNGNDTLDGGTGTDTATYGGVATITETATGWSVTTGTEGTDTLENVEIVDDSAPGVDPSRRQWRLCQHPGSDRRVERRHHHRRVGHLDRESQRQQGRHHPRREQSRRRRHRARGDETVIDGQITISAAGVTIDGVKMIGAAAGSLGNTGRRGPGQQFHACPTPILDGSGDIAHHRPAGVDRSRHRPTT